MRIVMRDGRVFQWTALQIVKARSNPRFVALLGARTEACMSSHDGHFARRATEADDEHDDEEHAGDEDGEPGREPLANARAADRAPLP